MKPQAERVDKFGKLLGACGEMLSLERLLTLTYWLGRCLPLNGALVEFGVYQGKTAALLSFMAGKPIYLYDSFEGLPEKHGKDITAHWYVKGHLKSNREEVLEWFDRNHLPPPNILAKWFDQLTEREVPRQIGFAHIDTDRYLSTLQALRLVYPRTGRGGVIVIDDYGNGDLQGVKPAVDEFVQDKNDLSLEACPCQAILCRL